MENVFLILLASFSPSSTSNLQLIIQGYGSLKTWKAWEMANKAIEENERRNGIEEFWKCPLKVTILEIVIILPINETRTTKTNGSIMLALKY